MNRDVVTKVHLFPPNQILAPALENHGVDFELHHDPDSLVRRVEENLGIVLFRGSTADIAALRAIRQSEPEWRQTPILLHGIASLENDQSLGNVTVLDANASESAVLGAIRAGLRELNLQVQKHADQEHAEAERRRVEEEFQQFVYAASHDLKEPLRMVSGYLQLLEKRYGTSMDAEAGEFIQLAVDGATRMSRLLSDLLTFARVGGRQKKLELVNGNDLVNWLRMNMQKALEENKATITSDPLPSILYDQTELLQLFELLISNSLKFGAGVPNLRVHIAAEERGGEWVFSVADNGPGFEPQHATRIFGVFKRLVGRDIPGTGMGLAVAKRIVEKYGGQIWATAQLGAGATFYFTVEKAARAASHL